MDNFTEKIIEVVKQHAILFDLSHPDYKNIRKKNKVWDEIGRLLNIDGENVKRKFKNLRDSYAKHLRAEKTHTGQKAKTINRYKTWPWVEQMSYFRPFLQFAQTQSNINVNEKENLNEKENEDEIENEDDEFESQTPAEDPLNPTPAGGPLNSTPVEVEGPPNSTPTMKETPRNVATRKRKAPNRDIESSIEKPSSVDKVLNYLNQNNKQETNYDELDLLCLGYAKTIRKMNARLQTLTKFKIAKVIMEAELEQQTETYSRPGTATDSEHSVTSWYEDFSQSMLNV